jgi:hypothetical protein
LVQPGARQNFPLLRLRESAILSVAINDLTG